MGNLFTTFTNCRLYIDGKIVEGERFVVSEDDGIILESTGYIGGELIDLEGDIIAPGFLELHSNGINGFHYTNFQSKEQYEAQLEQISKYYVTKGITSFWITLPTIEREHYQKILSCLNPISYADSADFLGVHLEGPFLNKEKSGAHSKDLILESFDHEQKLAEDVERTNSINSINSVYGNIKDNSLVKLVTIAPEIENSDKLIKELISRDIKVSMGHSISTYDQGLNALKSGVSCLTHTMNCMSPLNNRHPGLTGLVTLSNSAIFSKNEDDLSIYQPYFTLICDGIHLHPSIVSLLFRSNPNYAILISDSIELTGLKDGLYPPNQQIKHNQVKVGDKVMIEGTDTLVGSCIDVSTCLRNIVEWNICDLNQAIRSVTENIANFMNLKDRGKLEKGLKADFVIMDDDGNIKQTWVSGKKVWSL